MIIDFFLLIPIAVSFLITLVFMPYWISKAKEIKLTWKDMNKHGFPLVAGSGGLVALLGFTIGMMFFVAYRIFIVQNSDHLITIFASLISLLILGGIGFVDDILGWQKGGLSKRSRILFVAMAAIPLMVINAGKSSIDLPFLGVLDLGLLYPLFLIPLGIIGTTTTFNFLAGHNGLESGNGILVLTGLAFVAFFTGSSWISIICLCMASALFGLLLYNHVPAKVLPGDSITYPVGSLIAISAIIGNFEKIALFFFIPYILETALKSRGLLKKHSFGKPHKDGSLSLKYPKIYSLNHLAIHLMSRLGVKPTEKKVVYSIWIFQLIIILLGFVIFAKGIF